MLPCGNVVARRGQLTLAEAAAQAAADGAQGTSLQSGARRSSSPYEVLGVERNATAEQVRARYMELVRELHPDKHGQTVAAVERFQELQGAWYILGDASRRAEFDEFGTLAAPVTKMSPLMWAKLKFAKPEDASLMPNWGSDEPPLWFLAVAPFSVAFLAFLWSISGDLWNWSKESAVLRAGGWACRKCLIVHEAAVEQCERCRQLKPVKY
eukprot:TRINITY_DN28763_c0_g1_i4.p1 TRINITY_DN28763_c0_g1~~TRINITY_DN28763_c0_g1_i4.p1  ORF type:complete len:211 (-),score=32.12 TRINITY_DN28763_c0_g1_i4:74-706(-)